ncbi:MAG: mucoidy inhibitor MuiA family protein [Chloroflexi bacterium]|nr:mucoidy inhibitor MuiA family protein [Chloroflexota bacterium]
MSEIESKITRVILYPSSGRLMRTAQLELPAGTHELRLQSIPANIDPSSVSVNLKAGSRAVVLKNVTTERLITAQANREEVAKLEAEIKALKEEIQSARQRLEGSAAKIAHLDGLLSETRNVVFALNQDMLTIDDHFARIGHIDRERGKYIREQSQQRVDLQNLEERLAEKQLQYQAVSSRGNHESTLVKAEVEANEEAAVTLEVSYLQYSCGWQPVYRAALDQGKFSLAYEAQVTQKTGEDWQDVIMNLSTSSPLGFRQLPELDPWYLSHQTPPRVYTEQLMSRKSVEEPMPARAKRAQVEVGFSEAEVKDQGVSMQFGLPQPVSVPSKDTATRVGITVLELPVEVDLLIVPKLSSEAYRRVKITNDSKFTLMPGKAALFFNGEYLGENPLELTPAGGKNELSFGVDQRIVVEREILQEEISKKLLQDRNARSYKYQIKISNASKETLQAEVQDGTPLSREDDIKVKLEFVEPKPVQTDELNRMTWRLALAPGAEVVLRYQFTVEAPRDVEIAGLPMA